jgi:hypothetical protein
MKRKKRYKKHSMIKRSQNIFQGVWEALVSSESEDESIALDKSNDDNDQVEEERGEEGGYVADSSCKK